MNFQRFLSPVIDKAGSLMGGANGPNLEHRTWVIIEQVVAGIVLSMFLGMVGRFFPFYVTAGVLAAGGVAAWQLGRNFRVGSITFLGLSTMYFFLGQPAIVLLLSVLVGLGAGGYAGYRLDAGIGARIVAVIATCIGATAATIMLYALMYTVVLPLVHPLTVMVWNISPALSVLPTIAIALYCTLRQPANEHSWYWLATPVLAVLFCATFWPSHSYLAMAVGALVAAALAVFSFIDRPTEDRPHKSHRSCMAVAAAGVAFLGLFWLSTSWTAFYKYQMANAVSVSYADRLPQTNNNRLVPFLAGRDYCAQQNSETFTELSALPSPIVIPNDKGEEHFYWACLRKPTRFAGHATMWLTGGTEGILLADAGERGRFGQTVNVDFLFGAESLFTTGAFYARHPGSVAQPAMVGRTKGGEYRLLVPYVSRVLQWGAMVPELSGVMVVSPLGFIEDYTPAQAADAFPGVRLVPAALAREYADLWAQDSSLWDKHWSGDIMEVSEFAGANDNRYPFWQDFKGVGMKGVIPFEPVGKDQKALLAIGLFDRARMSMTVVRTEKLGLPGPKHVSNVALSHPGLFNVKAEEALLVVSESGKIYWLTALMQPDQQMFHGYIGNVVNDGNAQNHWDVDSGAKVDAAIAEGEKSKDAPK